MPKSRKEAASPKAPTMQEFDERATAGEIYKNLGNDLFREGKYKEAAVMYNEAVNTFGTQPVYMCNLAATYLKLQDYEMAEKAASLALIHDPRMTKARFRRGIARKENNKLKAAKIDFQTILKEDPSCAEAKVELAAVEWLCEGDGERDDSDGSADYKFPAPDRTPRVPLPMWLVSESDSEDSAESEIDDAEDSEHVGNGIPCKHHNRKPLGCAKGASCAYSHAPDARSMPDKEGRNVCLYFLLGSCKFEDRCLYSHSKANLLNLGADLRRHEVRDLITENELAIQERRLFSKYMGKGPLASDTLMAVKRATDKAKRKNARKAETLQAMIEIIDADPEPPLPMAAPAPFLMHLTLNKSTDIPHAALAGLRACVEVARAKSASKARSMLSSSALRGVLITDAGITLSKHAGLLAELAAYARAGGTVVLGGSFTLFVRNAQTDVADAQLAAFFRKGWGVAWRAGARPAARKTLALNARHGLAGGTGPGALPGAYSVTGLHLKGVSADDALYLPSEVDSAGLRGSDLVETPVVFAQLGKGHLGFVGDAGAESETPKILAAMFGLSSS
ncbi:hypothetical protein FB451DRAFT_1361732 [Mycena latifolia]|nr:hypothetical protein FB451DRAFT_1361732 [Mycena latifolia]